MVEVYKSKSTEFIQSFFLRLEQENVQYCILRNYAGLPNNLQGSDIDILVPPEKMKEFDTILIEMSTTFNLIIIQRIKSLGEWRYWLLDSALCLENPGLAIDVMFSIDWRGLKYLSAEELLVRRCRFGDYYILHPIHEVFLIIFGRILWGALPKDKYHALISTYTSQYNTEWQILLQEVFGARLGKEIFEDANCGCYGRILGYVSKLRLKCLLKNLFRGPCVCLYRFFMYHIIQIKNYVSYCGCFLAFVGPDGVGKSTIVEKCSQAFSRLKMVTRIFHWRPALIQPLSSYQKYLGGSEGGCPKVSSGTLGSIFRLIYYTFDYVCGYLYCVLPSLKRGEVVIFDRYFYDYFVDPDRIRTKYLGFVPRIVSLIIPKPDLVIALYAKPSNIHKRKPELSEEEIGRQITGFRSLCGLAKAWVSISTDGQPEKSAREAFSVIAFQMAALTELRANGQSYKAMGDHIVKSRLKKKMVLAVKRVLDGVQQVIPVYSLVINFSGWTRRSFLRKFGAIVKSNASIEGRVEFDDPSSFQMNQRSVAANLKICGLHCCLIDHDARAIDIRIDCDSIVTKHNIYQGDDKIEKGITLSVDIDGAVGLAHTSQEEFGKLRSFWDETAMAKRFLVLLKTYEIPAVWGISGHLFLEQCDAHHPYNEREWYGDWFLFDPGTKYTENPEWYMPNFIKTLIQEPLFEVAYHSFAHFTYSKCSPGTVARDMEFSSWVRKEYGLPLETFIFPHGTIGYIDEILEGGFTSLRGGFGRQAIARTIDFGKFRFYCTSRILNPSTIDTCLKNISESFGKNFNYYTHPWEWRLDENLGRFERFLEKLANLNRKGAINLQSMASSKQRPKDMV